MSGRLLHKLMYFIDFDYYEKYGEFITGITYKKNHHGPTFDSLLIKDLINQKLITCVETEYRGFKQKKYIANVDCDLSILSAKEIKHIDEILAKHSGKTAAQIEEYSHGDVPWIIAKEKEDILYESVFYRTDSYSARNDDLDDPI